MNIGKKITELENDLEMCRAIQAISEKWKVLLNNCKADEVSYYMREMMLEMGYSDREINVFLKR